MLVALVAPLLHHDFACELQSKIHCDACTVSSGAARVEPGITLISYGESVRQIAPMDVTARSCADRPSSPGRAPPVSLLSA